MQRSADVVISPDSRDVTLAEGRVRLGTIILVKVSLLAYAGDDMPERMHPNAGQVFLFDNTVLKYPPSDDGGN